MKRRNLLTGGIAMATLPNGAALANASSAQCLVADSQRRFDPAVLRDPLAPWVPADDALRVMGRAYEWGNEILYEYNGRFYNAIGEETAPPPPGLEGRPVDLLIYYEPSRDWTQIVRIGPYPLVQPGDGFQGVSPSCMASIT